MAKKGNADKYIRETIKFIKRIHKVAPCIVRSDNVKEFTRESIMGFLHDKGVEDQQPVPIAHSANGSAERHVGIIKSKACALLRDSGLDAEHWDKAA
eukprot:36484-Chlamydomonas_euryale.AAC.2